MEQYRRVAAALHDAQIERNVKTVMVTSAMPREGKTLTTRQSGVDAQRVVPPPRAGG